MRDRPFPASGAQIAFLVFAVVFLGAPAQKYLGPWLGLDATLPSVAGRLFFFIPAILILFLVPALRRYCRELLRSPIPKPHRREVAIVVAADALFLPLAIFGGVVLWYWMSGGEMALARRLGQQETASVAMSNALSLDGIALVMLATLIAPVIEELIFRGILFSTWEAEWGWFKGLVATSVIFAAYHPVPVAAFFGSVLLTTLYKRTRSIRGCILAHALHNGLLWYPLMGQFFFRTAGKETGEIELWPLHLAMLAACAVALPAYLWMARDRESTEPSSRETAAAHS
jgi:membrane protease YdiL (CAAX protease family)